MFSRIYQKPSGALLDLARTSKFQGLQKRAFANVEGNTPRQTPAPRTRQTAVSHDTANLTIRVQQLA